MSAPDQTAHGLAHGAERTRAFVALFTAGVLWGASFFAGKIALEAVDPTWLIASRFGLASLVLLPLVPWRRMAARWRAGEIGPRDVAMIFAGAFLAGPIMFVLQFEGLARTTASSAALLVAVAPPLMAVGAAVVDGERAGRTVWAAIGLSTVGVALLVGAPGPGRTLIGDALCLISMVGATAWTLLSRRIARRVGALSATALQFAAGFLLVVPLAFVREGAPPVVSGAPLVAVLFLGLVCTATTFVLWTWGVLRVEAARAGVIANVEPVVGSLLGVLVLGEVLGVGALVGGAILVVAALIATRAEAVGEAPEVAPPPVP